jgi:hypothetical protein
MRSTKKREAEEALRAAEKRLAEAQAAVDDLGESGSESENGSRGDINISVSGVAGAHGLVIRGCQADKVVAALRERNQRIRGPSGDINIATTGHAGRGYTSIDLTI